MKERLTMNSASLQERFPEIYREFFSKCPIVVSAPGSFFWCGEFSVMEGGLAITQKLPFRVYVGVEPTKSKRVYLNEVQVLDPSKEKFTKFTIEEPVNSKIVRFLERFVSRGYRIWILSEVPNGCGMNMSGAFSDALAIAVLLYEGKLVDQNISRNFEKIFRLAWKIEAINHGDISSGTTAYTPLTRTLYPVIFFSEKRGGDFHKLAPGARFPKNVRGNYGILDRIYYRGISLDKLIGFESAPSWPIDFGLIYSGDIRTTSSTNVAIEEIRESLDEASPFVVETFSDLFRPEKQNIPFFYELCTKEGWRGLWQNYLNALITSSLETLLAFKKIFHEGLTSGSLKLFFRSINTHHDQLKAINLSSNILEYICRKIQDEVEKLGDEYGAGVKLLGSGEKGDILFALAYHGLRDQIHRVITTMRRETKEDIWLDYASWLDGIEEEGAKIEQHLAEGIYSPFISEGSMSLKSYTKEGVAQTELTSLEEFEKERSKIDLLIDQIASDIYICGRKLTSKELPSSSATEEILTILLENLGKSIANDKLPESSYSGDRNEMQSKIVTPLVRAVKKYTGKTLPLRITGGLTDFRLKLEPSDLDIRVLNKVF